MSQTTYNVAPAVAIEGMIADAREATVILSRLAQGLVPIGKLCASGTDSLVGPPLASFSANSVSPGQVKALPTGLLTDPLPTTSFLGIPIYDGTQAPYDATLGYSCWANQSYVSVLKYGPIYVKPETGSTCGDSADVYVRVTANGAFNVLGSFSDSAGTGKVKLSQARWESGIMSGSLAILRLL